MSSQDNDPDMRVVAVVLVSTLLLAVGLAAGMGFFNTQGGDAPESPPQAAAPVVVAAPVASVVTDDASVVVESNVVKFYFASGKAELAAGARGALDDAVAAAQSGQRLVIAGFHDATGDATFNAELARQRALAVRDILLSAGVAESRIELRKPEQTTGSGNDAEARRVEVMIAD